MNRHKKEASQGKIQGIGVNSYFVVAIGFRDQVIASSPSFFFFLDYISPHCAEDGMHGGRMAGDLLHGILAVQSAS